MIRELIVDLGEDRSYPIYIGEGLLDGIADRFEAHGIGPSSRILIVTDEGVAPHYLGHLEKTLQQRGYSTVNAIVEAGETSKSLSVFEDIITIALEAGLDRHSVVIALGGGVVGDLAGFVAASYMRGVRFVQIPTTILAHDSSVGGKVAVNHRLAKNIIGAFHQPEMVLYDTSTLKTLPPREVRAGLAEMVKHGLIWDKSFVEWCSNHADELLALDPDALQYGLYEGCRVKSIVVSHDEREQGLRAILNLGHTIGHALEAVGQYGDLLHGEAISIGMVGAARLAERFGYSPNIHQETKRLLERFGLPTQLPESAPIDSIMHAMMHDKKFKEGRMVFIIPVDIGAVKIRSDVPVDWVRETLVQLKKGE